MSLALQNPLSSLLVTGKPTKRPENWGRCFAPRAARRSLWSAGLVTPEDGRPTEAEALILPLTPDEALVVDVAKGLNSGSLIEQAHSILMKAAYGVGYYRKESNVEGFVWACVLAILSVRFRL